MQQTPFHAYYNARILESLSEDDRLIPVFASSDIKVFPFQIAAASFALRSPYQKGVILCDESGMGKSHEAMLAIVQRWYEGKNRILLCIPNADLLKQWVEMIESRYTVPFVVVDSEKLKTVNENPFEQDGIVIATYDCVYENSELAFAVNWDLTVFEEANALSSVYQQDNKQGKTLKAVAENSFKLLLTGTPIEKNIMDLYGLIYFIDETILEPEDGFLARYLRKPENYPELAERVSKYCFRTLRSQAKRYAKLPKRIPITYEYSLSEAEQELYNRLFAYCRKEDKIAFPDMNQYDLTLMILGSQGSSTAAVLQTIGGIIKRLEKLPNGETELSEFKEIELLAKGVAQDAKTDALLVALEKCFKVLKKAGANKKALIFTESVATQKYLYEIIGQRYKTVLYNSSADYSDIKSFKDDGEILIATDHGAKGFDLSESALVIQYDLLFNTLKMEQRIDRCHRLGQENDVISLAFIDKNNFADVRKLELVNKRLLVTEGVFGISDTLIGGFTNNLDDALKALLSTTRTREQVEEEYLNRLESYEDENKQAVSAAEDILFTTFTKELADKLKVTPKYIEAKAEELNQTLWQLVRWYFTQRNKTHTDCYFEIDDSKQTVTATNYETLPKLFYYFTGGRNKPYISLKSYGMAKDFKPHHGRITLSSIIGRGIINELECAEFGALKTDNTQCKIALYDVEIYSAKHQVASVPILVGMDSAGKIMTDEQCQDILQIGVESYTEEGRTTAHWLRTSSSRHELDLFVPTDGLIEKQMGELTAPQAEEVERIKRRAMHSKVDISHNIGDLQGQIRQMEGELSLVSSDRMKTLALTKKLNALKAELAKKKDKEFFQTMQFDIEVENQINEFLGKEKLTAKVIRQFVVEVG